MKEKLLKQLLKGPSSLIDIANSLQTSMIAVVKEIEKIKEEGYNVIEEGNYFHIKKTPDQETKVYNENWEGQENIRFGVVSDTHLCSNNQQKTLLNQMYDIYAQEKIIKVYHAGDIGEGDKMRRGHEYEIFCHGADKQTNYIIENYPSRKGIETHFITGNHDLSFMKRSGYDIGRKIEEKREDMKYLGMEEARIMLTPNCSMDLAHPRDGAAYALSYATQKYCDALQGGSKPSILVVGHHHKAICYQYRNIQVIEAGTFQSQTKFMKGKRIAAHVGGWIIEINVDKEGTIRRFKTEWYPFFNMIKDDY